MSYLDKVYGEYFEFKDILERYILEGLIDIEIKTENEDSITKINDIPNILTLLLKQLTLNSNVIFIRNSDFMNDNNSKYVIESNKTSPAIYYNFNNNILGNIAKYEKIMCFAIINPTGQNLYPELENKIQTTTIKSNSGITNKEINYKVMYYELDYNNPNLIQELKNYLINLHILTTSNNRIKEYRLSLNDFLINIKLKKYSNIWNSNNQLIKQKPITNSNLLKIIETYNKYLIQKVDKNNNKYSLINAFYYQNLSDLIDSLLIQSVNINHYLPYFKTLAQNTEQLYLNNKNTIMFNLHKNIKQQLILKLLNKKTEYLLLSKNEQKIIDLEYSKFFITNKSKCEHVQTLNMFYDIYKTLSITNTKIINNEQFINIWFELLKLSNNIKLVNNKKQNNILTNKDKIALILENINLKDYELSNLDSHENHDFMTCNICDENLICNHIKYKFDVLFKLSFKQFNKSNDNVTLDNVDLNNVDLNNDLDDLNIYKINQKMINLFSGDENTIENTIYCKICGEKLGVSFDEEDHVSMFNTNYNNFDVIEDKLKKSINKNIYNVLNQYCEFDNKSNVIHLIARNIFHYIKSPIIELNKKTEKMKDISEKQDLYMLFYIKLYIYVVLVIMAHKQQNLYVFIQPEKDYSFDIKFLLNNALTHFIKTNTITLKKLRISTVDLKNSFLEYYKLLNSEMSNIKQPINYISDNLKSDIYYNILRYYNIIFNHHQLNLNNIYTKKEYSRPKKLTKLSNKQLSKAKTDEIRPINLFKSDKLDNNKLDNNKSNTKLSDLDNDNIFAELKLQNYISNIKTEKDYNLNTILLYLNELKHGKQDKDEFIKLVNFYNNEKYKPFNKLPLLSFYHTKYYFRDLYRNFDLNKIEHSYNYEQANKELFFEKFNFECPIIGFHIFDKNMKCTKCKISKDKILNNDDSYYNQYKLKFNQSNLKLKKDKQIIINSLFNKTMSNVTSNNSIKEISIDKKLYEELNIIQLDKLSNLINKNSNFIKFLGFTENQDYTIDNLQKIDITIYQDITNQLNTIKNFIYYLYIKSKLLLKNKVNNNLIDFQTIQNQYKQLIKQNTKNIYLYNFLINSFTNLSLELLKLASNNKEVFESIKQLIIYILELNEIFSTYDYGIIKNILRKGFTETSDNDLLNTENTQELAYDLNNITTDYNEIFDQSLFY